MATYLKFDGVNDQALRVDGAGTWPSDGVMTYEIAFTRGSVALNGGVADAFCPANGRGLYLSDTTFQLYWDFGSFRSTYSFNNPIVEGEDKKLTFEFLADKLTVNVYEDDILHTVITSNKAIPAASDDVNVGTRYGGTSPCNALIRSIRRAVPSSAADSRFWDADSSDTSNTGQQPVLTETLNGFDAVGVNMNTDGSDWVITGEPEVDFDISAAFVAPSVSLSGEINYSIPDTNISASFNAPAVSLDVDLSATLPGVDVNSAFNAPSVSLLASIEHQPPEINASTSFIAPSASLSAAFAGDVPLVDVSADFTAPMISLTSNLAATAPEFNINASFTAPSVNMASSLSITVDDTDLSAAFNSPMVRLSSVVVNGDIIKVTPQENIIHSKPRSTLLFTKDKGRYL